MTEIKQWDFVYAWNYDNPKQKVRTRFLHTLDNTTPANICVAPHTLDKYPKDYHLRRYDKVVPEDSRVHLPDSMYQKATKEEEIPNFAWAFSAITIIAVVFMTYVVYNARSAVDDIRKEHYELRGTVSDIRIKSDDTANQLALSIESQYWYEIKEAIEIAVDAGYNGYTKLVFINPSLNTLRLSNIDGSEIQVNIETKVITTYSQL